MSISTVTAARIYKGQKAGKLGEEEQLYFDRFPYTALSRVLLFYYRFCKYLEIVFNYLQFKIIDLLYGRPSC